MTSLPVRRLPESEIPFDGILQAPGDLHMTEFAIPFPEAGTHAILIFEAADFLKLEEAYGDGYVAAIFAGLDRTDVKVIKNCLNVGIKGGDPAAALNAAPLDEIGTRIADALYLRMKGFKLSEAVPR